jgi:uncharacterized membrane protein YfcA
VAPALVIGNSVGERFFGKVNPRVWRAAILALLALSAAVAVWRFTVGR